jgi:hypothetical protein
MADATCEVKIDGATAVLLALANDFDSMDRIGAEKDEPEGSRYVQISDTLMRMMSAALRQGKWPPTMSKES